MNKTEIINKLIELSLTLCYDHSKLSPSASKRWMTCAGSIALIEKLFIDELTKYFEKLDLNQLKQLLKSKSKLKALINSIQNTTSKYAAEGTVAHEICETCLLKNKKPEEFLGLKMEADGFTFTVNQNMVDACNVYVDYINEYIHDAMAQANITIDCQVEVKCSLKPLKIKGLDGGTSDCILINKDQQVLDVIDYKHGSGVAVEVKNNTQAMQYGLGALLKLQEEGEDISDWQVYLTIIQPRAIHKDGPIRIWNVSAKALLTWKKDILIPAAKETHKENAELVPSDEGCLFCPVKDCAARYAKVTETAMIDFEDCSEGNKAVLPEPHFMTVEQKINVMDHIKMIRSFLVAVENQVKQEVDSGSQEYKGRYKLVRSNTQRKLLEDAFDEIASPLLDYIEEDDLYTKKRKGIGELEAALKDKFRADGTKGFTKKVKQILDEVTNKPEGELVIAPESDTRKEVPPSIVSDFDDLED